jgi:hypothetical protein
VLIRIYISKRWLCETARQHSCTTRRYAYPTRTANYRTLPTTPPTSKQGFKLRVCLVRTFLVASNGPQRYDSSHQPQPSQQGSFQTHDRQPHTQPWAMTHRAAMAAPGSACSAAASRLTCETQLTLVDTLFLPTFRNQRGDREQLTPVSALAFGRELQTHSFEQRIEGSSSILAYRSLPIWRYVQRSQPPNHNRLT